MPVASTTLERPPLDRETVERFSQEREEHEALRRARLAALQRYLATPWPKSDVGEEWRRFPIKELPLDALGAAAAATRPGRAVVGDADRASGVRAEDLRTLARRRPDLVHAYVAREGGPSSHAGPRRYAEAAWAEGTFVLVPAGVVAERPVELTTHAGLTRTVIVAERDSAVTVVEDLTSPEGGPGVAVPLLDVFVEPGASATYVQLQRFDPDVWNIGAQRYDSMQNSRLASFNLVVGGGRSKVGVHSEILGDGALVRLYGLVAAGGAQRVDFNTFQDLAASHAESTLLYLAALYEHAKAVTYGVIRVEPHTSATSSYQELRNLLLSEDAGANPIPVLEILANDVLRCGHGAAAGSVDAAELFYVMARGLPRDVAERLIVRGFFERVIGNVPDEAVRRRMLETLRPRIGAVAEIEEEREAVGA